jgi:group I intron endonuclease
MCGVYLITSPSGKKYVGQSANMRQRWDSHKSMLKAGKHHSPALQRAANKYGVARLKFEVWVNCAREFLGEMEQEAGVVLLPEYNAGAYGSSPTLGIVFGPEARKRMSQGQTGLKRGEYSAEHRKAISDAKKGKARPDKIKFAQPVKCLETGEMFENASTAERSFGKKSSGNILKACRGEVARAYGFHWEF